MDRFQRIFALHRVLSNSRYPVSRTTLEEKLECSKSTIERIIAEMRDYLHAPIEFDHKLGGYFYNSRSEHPYQLPGLWFNPSELHALLSTQQLLHDVQPGLLDSHLSPLKKRIEEILDREQLGSGEVRRRVRIVSKATRQVDAHTFQLTATGLLKRHRLKIDYHNRSDDDTNQREVSPQRIIFYQGFWYLDAWCHQREALRTFSLDRIRKVVLCKEVAIDIEDKELDRELSSSYGIFSGESKHKAVLKFTAEQARWISDEQWHPQQTTRWLDDGAYEITIPYNNDKELIMDILKFGPDVEVVSPLPLREAIANRLRTALSQYL